MPSLGWGAGGLQALEESRMNQQQMQMNSYALAEKKREDEAAAAQAELDKKAGELFKQSNNGDLPGGGILSAADNAAAASGDRSAIFNRLGDFYLQNGATSKALAFYKSASELSKDERDAAGAQVKQKTDAIEAQLKQADLVAQYLGDPNQSSEQFEAGKQALIQSGAFTQQEQDAILALPFSPEVVRTLNEHAMSAKDRLEAEHQALTDAREQANTDSLIQERRSMSDLGFIEQKSAAEARGRAVKTGAGAPTREETDAAATLIDLHAGVQPDDKGKLPAEYVVSRGAAAVTVAARAKELMSRNSGLSWSVALNNALTEVQASGGLATTTYHSTFLGIPGRAGSAGSKTKFDRLGSNPDNPLPMPPKIDMMDKKKYYNYPGKGIIKWDGKGWVTVE